MAKEEGLRTGNGGGGKGSVAVVGIGPGGLAHLTGKAREAIENADCVVGYTRYVQLIRPLAEGKELFTTGMTHEVERCNKALELARAGRRVAVVSSGDAGIYGMAGLILQLRGEGAGVDIEVVPGVPAFVAASAILGAPLMHDFASISLSDLLTDWLTIEARVEAAAKAGFVMVFYNPKSSKRVEGLGRAVDIVRSHRAPSTPVGIVRNATREGEEVTLTTLGGIDGHYGSIDMLTIVIIGNPATFTGAGRMITPRGYRGV
ncbi:MAG: precorrin-3B C(17)-methyltransferase [Deltaproteobacteria bacterium]|nr:precorrin-3B C(17)-methyltransferase [Deltaproteobacteria bacterium]